MAAIAELRLEEINAKEDLSLRLGDALDIKASIGLAVILFLATQTAYFFDKGLSRVAFVMQIISIICIIAAAVFAMLELWPRRYVLPEPESEIISARIEQLEQHYAAYDNPVVNTESAFIKDEIQWAKNRIAENQKKNKVKSDFLNKSFWFTAVAVVTNLLTVLAFVKWAAIKSIF